ncbi:MAG: hypothetical protein SFX18_02570 [Pirellulales bacterium]|nr:hypothetical protein [Pirellulales bacterium]
MEIEFGAVTWCSRVTWDQSSEEDELYQRRHEIIFRLVCFAKRERGSANEAILDNMYNLAECGGHVASRLKPIWQKPNCFTGLIRAIMDWIVNVIFITLHNDNHGWVIPAAAPKRINQGASHKANSGGMGNIGKFGNQT